MVRPFEPKQRQIAPGAGQLELSTDLQSEGMGRVQDQCHTPRRQMLLERVLGWEWPHMQVIQMHTGISPCRSCTDNTDTDAVTRLQQSPRDSWSLAGSGKDQHMVLAIPPAVHQDGAHRPGRG